MENRFTAKDFFLFFLVTLVLVTVIFMMFQYDRIGDSVGDLQGEVEEYRRDVDDLGRQLRALNRRAIEYASQIGGGAIEPDQSIFEDDAPSSMFERLIDIRAQDDFAEGDTLMLSFGSRVEKVSAFTYSTANASDVQSWVLEPLCVRNPRTLDWEPFIARDWEEKKEPKIDEETGEPVIDEESGEPAYTYTYTFFLRDDVRFSDGEPLTAHDVAFTHRFIMDERIAANRFRISRARISEVEVVDDYTVSFRFDEPFFRAFEIAASTTVIPEHYYGQFLESAEAAEEYNDSTAHLIGTGPYVLRDQHRWDPGRPIQLNRNTRYWGVQPAFDRIEYRVITEDAVRRTAFENGEIDLYNARPGDLRQLKERHPDKEFFQYLAPTAAYSYIGWKQYEYRDGQPDEPTIFADPKVRQAMTYLIDRDRIRRRVYRELAIICDGPFHPALAQHNPEISPREPDISKARELLLEAGCTYDGRYLRKPDGELFQFTITYPAGSTDTRNMMNEVQQSLGEVGIVAELEPTQFDVLVQRLNERDFDAICLGWSSGFEIDIYQMFHSSQVAEGSGENFVAYKNEELDELIDRARRTMDEEERMEIWQETHRILYEDQPYTFLFRRQSLVFADERIRGIKILKDPQTGEELDRLNSGGHGVPLEWYVPREEQRY